MNRRINMIYQSLSYVLILALYQLSLEGCDPKVKQTQCVEWIMTKLTQFSIQIILLCFLLTLNLWLTIAGYFSSLNYLSIVGCFAYFFMNASGSTTYDHSEYNFILISIITALMNFIAMNVFITLKMRAQMGTFAAVFVMGGIYVCIPLAYYQLHIHNSCAGVWDKGFQDSVMIQNEDYCYIEIPDYCWYDILAGVQDISGWMHDTCQNEYGNPKNPAVTEFYQKNKKETNFYAFPRFEYWNRSRTDFIYFIDEVANRIQDYDKLTKEEQDQTEVILDVSGEYPRVNIRVKRNETLAAQAKKQEQKLKAKHPTNTKLPRNIFWFYIDAVSRQMLKRKMGKTYSLLEQWYNDKEGEYESFQFFRYYSLAPNTAAALLPLDYGVHYQTVNGTGNKSYLEYFREAGFVTAFAKNNCGVEDFDANPGDYQFLNLYRYDHSLNALFCDPNYFDRTNPYSNTKGPFSARRRCLYGKDTFQYILEYSEQFWKAYPQERKFMKTHFSDHHEWTAEVVKYMDDPVFNFFSSMIQGGYFKDTAILFAADHGHHMAGVLYLMGLDVVMKERYFPMFYMLLPRENADQIREYAKANEQVYFTGWDIRKTLQHFAYGQTLESQDIGHSLISDKIPTTNSCEDTPIQKPWDCYCSKQNGEN